MDIKDRIKRIKKIAEKIIPELNSGRSKKVIEGQLKKIISLDVHELRKIKKMGGRDTLINECEEVLEKAKKELKNLRYLSNYHEDFQRLIEEIIFLENQELSQEWKIEKYEDEVKKYFANLLDAEHISPEDCNAFLEKIKGNTNNKIHKKISKVLKKKIKEERLYPDPGPRYSSNNVDYLKTKIDDYFSSPFAQRFPKDQKIKFYLFGSLVNGYCNNPTKSHFKTPSDLNRTSDVDMLIVVGKKFFEDVFEQNIIVEIHGTKRTKPIGFDTNPGPDATGPFNEIFEYIRPLSFAGNRRRPVHLVFLKQKSLLFINLLKEPHIHIRDITT